MDEEKGTDLELSGQSMESLLYLLFMEGNTQKDAIETLYNKEYSSINVKPFTEARKRMLDKGWIDSDGALRGAEFKTNVDPFIDYVAKKKDLDGDQKRGLKEFVDSDWFRSFFTLDMVAQAPEVGRNTEGRMAFQLNSEGAFHTLGLVIDDLGSFSHTQITRAKEWIDSVPQDTNPETLEDIEDFDSQIEGLKGWVLKGDPENFKQELFQSEVKGACRIQEIQWRKHFLDKIIVQDELAFKLPDLSSVVPIYHLNSDLWGEWPHLSPPQQ